MDVAGKIWILPASGGKFKKSFHKKFSGRIAYCTILTINPLVNKSVNFPPLAGKIRILPAGSTFGPHPARGHLAQYSFQSLLLKREILSLEYTRHLILVL